MGCFRYFFWLTLGLQAVSENMILSDSLGYQALNARAAKDALLHRTQILEDSQTAAKAAINKRRNVERLRGSSSINPLKVDDAIAEMDDVSDAAQAKWRVLIDQANNLENGLQSRLNAISRHLHVALRTHSRYTHEDVALALLENARLTVGFHKHALKELEILQSDLTKIGSTTAPAPYVNTPTRPQLPSAPSVPSTMGDPRASLESDRMSREASEQRRTQMDGSKSMFLPPSHQSPSRPGSTGPPQMPLQAGGAGNRYVDPLGEVSGLPGGQTAQSMMLPGRQGSGQAQRAQTMGRAGGKRLDERQAAKLLAGGF